MSQRTARRGSPPSPGSPSPRRLRAFLIVASFVAAVAGAAVAGWQFARESKPVAGPIVLVTIDGLRADRLPAYGYGGTSTPHLDQVAAQAVVFDRAYAHAPLTLPAHASLLTGQLPFRHQVRDDMGYQLGDRPAALAALLSGRGFDTGAAVSSWLLREDTGIGRGYDTFDSALDEEAQEAAAPPALERADGATARAAARWLAAQRSDRLFYWLHLRGPAALAASAAPTRGAAYDAAVRDADAAVGLVLDALRARGWYDQSLVVVTGTHGDALGEGERSHALTLSDAVLQVPLLVKMPDADEPRRVPGAVRHVDVVPTLLDLVRAPMPGSLDGRSLRAVLEDDQPLPSAPIYAETLYAHVHFGGVPAQALFSRDAPDAPQPPAGREALDALVGGAPIPAPAWTSAADRERYATLGHPAFSADLRLPVTADADSAALTAALDDYREAMRVAADRGPAAAIDVVRQLAARHPEAPQLAIEHARLLQRAGRLDDAVAVARALAARAPERAEPPVLLGQLLVEQARLDEAQKALLPALDIADAAARTRGIALETLARVAIARRDPETARARAASAAEAEPGVPIVAYVDARLLQDDGDDAGALARYDEAAKAAPRGARPVADLQWRRGDTLSRLDRFEDAEAAFLAALEEMPHDVRPYASLATLYHVTRRDDDAAEALAALLRAVPTAQGYVQAARLWQVLGNTAEADALRRQARERFKGDPALRALPR